MKYIKLGHTGLEVSKICIGCMNFGVADQGRLKWVLDEEKSREIMKHALNCGINYFDTANSYSGGTSEEFVGRALKDYANRDEVVIATKVYNPTGPGPNCRGLSRKAIMSEVDKSLKRLGTDYIDLYQIHRWDYETPIEETMEALHDLVKMGKVRYIGASAMYAWQFSKAQYTAEMNGWTKFCTMQDTYNLLYREEEREMHPLCKDQGVGVVLFSPLARGKLARPDGTETERSKVDPLMSQLYPLAYESDHEIIRRVQQVAEKRGVSMAKIAMAWVLGKDTVACPIVGPSKIPHIDDAVDALSITLTPEETAFLEEPYVPHKLMGFK